MPVSQNSLANLVVGKKGSWNHTPSKPIRVPEIFATQLLDIARKLDNGEDLQPAPENTTAETVIAALPTFSLHDLSKISYAATSLQEELQAQQSQQDAKAITLSELKSWANDNQQIELLARFVAFLETQKRLTVYQARMVKALAAHIPINDYYEWESTNDYRLVFEACLIRLYSPKDPTGKLQSICKSIKGYRFERYGCYWSFPLARAGEVLEKFVDYPFDVSPDFEAYLALQPYFDHQQQLLADKELAEQQHREKEAQERKERLLEQQRLQKKQQEEARKAEQARKEAERLQKQQLWDAQTQELLAASGYDQQLSNGWHLREYQRTGVEFLVDKRRGNKKINGGILADEMGLGKTLTALAAAKAFQQQTGCAIFVVAPATLLANWRREAAIVGVQIEVYSTAKIPQPLALKKYVAIFDEAHFYQSMTSQRTQKMLAIASHENSLATWLLTGTPLKNGRPINLLPLLVAVNHPVAAYNQRGYEERYCNGHFRVIGKRDIWDTTGASYLEELNSKIQDVLLRRTKKECLPDLPDKSNLFVSVQLDSKTNKLYREEIAEFAADYRERAAKGDVDAGAEALATLTAIRRIGSSYKVQAALERLEEIDGSVVIFTEFKESAARLAEALGKDAVLLTGDTPVDQRQGLVDKFQEGDAKYFVGTIKAGGVGLTLTKSSNVILVDRPWTPGDCDQAIDRCHRSGQENAVFAHWLQLGDVDLAIDNLLFEKQDRIKIVLKKKRLDTATNVKDLAKKLLSVL